MELLIVSGLSGAGKTQTIHALEDIGYYCMDNVPADILPKLTDLLFRNKNDVQKMAVVIDVRGAKDSDTLRQALHDMDMQQVQYKILFLEAQPEVLERRFKETRRRHPLCLEQDLSLREALAMETSILMPLRERANYRLDTTWLNTAQNRERVIAWFKAPATEEKPMGITIISFGFKFGVPGDADLVFDVRCLPNPFYVPELKHKTGMEQAVVDYVMQAEASQKILQDIQLFLEDALPLYVSEGKSMLTIATGCTGGKHRSITFARLLGAWCTEKGYKVNVVHRDIER